MNIKQAKEELKNSIRAYLLKDAAGAYVMEDVRRRPLLLMGPPGIGKTAIMEQIAEELNINLVSYTITHHTRQSAIGLPVVSQRIYGGKEYTVTDYTMSEIVASVYDRIEESGNPEGILFLDEINCVSETLMPTMLQFLQYKTFGTHKVPGGFVIVCAGNPAKYNRAVRDFDIVTLDRLRRFDIEEDYGAWKEYASERRIHGSILAFLDIKKDCFYSVRPDVEEMRFVTARGWEDLSATVSVYEKLGMAVTEGVVGGFLQDKEIASAFALYYELYRKYHEDFKIDDILAGTLKEGDLKMQKAPFDEKLSLLHLLFDAVDNDFYEYDLFYEKQLERFEELKRRRAALDGAAAQTADTIDAYRADAAAFAPAEQDRMAKIEEIQEKLKHVFLFIDRTFGEGQEMVIFLTSLSSGFYSKKFLHECGSVEYDKYSSVLLLNERKSA
ncbi:MAG: AAA family ATPase, partial [Lachnospiraceae bacterium]|nr:AAA family ATPase [Lachnospiraceae bacterium]